MVARNIEGRNKAFSLIEKLIAQGEPIRFIDISKLIGVPPTTVKRVYDENFKGKGIIGRARNSSQVIDQIISTGIIDKEQIKKIAKDKYKVNIEDRAIFKKINIAKDASVEEYIDDFKKMVSDPNYVPKFVKPATQAGMTANQIQAKNIVKSTTQAFEEKLKKNINKRKKLKRASDPEKRAKDLAAASERRVTRRIKEKDVALTNREKNINLEQRKLVKDLNNRIRNNPKIILDNKDLMEKLSITVSKDGNIIKIPPGLTETNLKKRGLFEIDHQRDIFKKGRGKNLPANRNLIAGPYNRTGGFKQMAEKFIESNPNPEDPKVKNILKVAEDLKVTLQPSLKEGVFATKALGFKQAADPVGKFKETTLKYNAELGAFENVKTQTVAPQAEIKQYAVDNPMEVKVGEPAKLPKANKSVLKTVGKTLAAVGAPLPTALLDTYFINEQIKQDKTTSEIVSNPLNWLGLATMSPLSRAAGIDKAGKVNTALRLGLNPGTIRGISRFVGLPGLALSTAMTAYDQYTKYKNQEGFIYKMFNKEES